MSNGLNATGVDTTDAPFTSIAPREDRTGDGWVSRRVTTNGVVSVGCFDGGRCRREAQPQALRPPTTRAPCVC